MGEKDKFVGKGIKKPTKTISGVAPLAVMLPPRACKHGACLYCPSLNAPQSYTPESPAVLRAKECDYNAWKQVKVRLESFKAMGHPTDKIELIIMGGTFLQYPSEFKESFVRDCYDALNGVRSKTLEDAKKKNEKAKNRCVALCIETRPDWCTDSDVEDMLRWGATRVELGVQFVNDRMYRRIKRGHKVKDVVLATERLKRAGFKIGYHLMPGLPGSSFRKDLKMFKKVFSSTKFRPDQIKIYPCQVLKGSDLENWYYKKKYVPYEKEKIVDLIVEIMKIVPRYCRVMRIMREIPLSFLVAGTKHIDLRRDVEGRLRKEKSDVKEIRFREVGLALRDKRKVGEDLRLKVTKYLSSKGKEYFLEVVDENDLLFGLLRLRLDLGGAMVRELHVYGPALDLGKEGKVSQHRGLGKWLMSEAEKIASEKGFDKIRVISGVGVREYYRKLGYELDGEGVYVEKEI